MPVSDVRAELVRSVWLKRGWWSAVYKQVVRQKISEIEQSQYYHVKVPFTPARDVKVSDWCK